MGLVTHPSRKRIGLWNIRSLCATGGERILVDELSRHGICIMGLQEVRWHGDGELCYADFNILWSGPAEGHPRLAGVALVLSNQANRALIEWHQISKRLMVARFRHLYDTMLAIVCYAPTNEASAETKDLFYTALKDSFLFTRSNDHIICPLTR
ncbi:hypothetical protein HELRODRAFT_164271 [Helobdella robusta]|uniref:Endonuclease/exonuclease/phosphatase domain-containing protein n=1 Tax=Helobdella robusta TaxID=6412 RepID=T1EV68_HELRO|nr:hypothetical protein HELRODRAFT_164271 [Helobdella robusta]ESN94430.1 hypothetical protein HELRODRAFT_164271 [Helobdella robusta]